MALPRHGLIADVGCTMMRRIIIILTLTCSLLSSAAADWSVTNGLAVRITTEQSVIHPGETLRVIVELRNTSTNALVIHKIPSLWEWLIVTDAEGREYASYPNTIPSLPPPSTDQFVLLDPGKSHTRVLMAELIARHSATNQHWKPQFMRFVAGMRDYDVPEGVSKVYYLKREFRADQLTFNGKSRTLSEHFHASQWLGEVKSATIKVIATKEQPTTPRTVP